MAAAGITNSRARRVQNTLRCRLCRTVEADEWISIYCHCASQDKLVLDMIKAVTRLDDTEINPDGVSSQEHICSQCLSRLDAACSLLRMVQEGASQSLEGDSCQICRRKDVDELISVLCVCGEDQKLVADMLTEACGLIAYDGNKKDRYICGECFALLSAANSFQHMVTKSKSTLKGAGIILADKRKTSDISSMSTKKNVTNSPLLLLETPNAKSEAMDPFIYLDSESVGIDGLKSLFFTKESAEFHEELIFQGIVCCCLKMVKDDSEWKKHCCEDHNNQQPSTKCSNLLYKCNVCNRTFKQPSHLAKHQQNRKRNLFYRCKICNIMTLERKSLLLHFEFTRFHPVLHDSEAERISFDEMVETDFESSGECCGCVKKFESGKDLLEHAQTVHLPQRKSQPSYECSTCYTSFPNGQSLFKHQLVYLTSKIYYCKQPKCLFKATDSLTAIKGHIESNVHQYEPSEFFCCFSGCFKTFESMEELKQHCMNQHAEQRIINSRFSANAKDNVCNLCNRQLPSDKSFKDHLQAQYDRKYACATCGRKFASRIDVKNHERAAHPTEERPTISCDRCHATFVSKYNLDKHIKKVHDKIRSELCTACGKCFFDKRSLKEHTLNIHLDMEDKPYKCRKCSMAFGNRYLLQRHQTTHSEERPHTCAHCGNAYRHLSDLKRHVDAIHLDLKPYVCHACDARFYRNRELRLHMVRHTKSKLYKCSVRYCLFATNVQKKMDRHQTEQHADYEFQSTEDC